MVCARSWPSVAESGASHRATGAPAGGLSLLPESLCSRLTGTLAEVEAVGAAVELFPSLEAASEAVRTDIV
jgi:hypothetical protein